MTDVRDPAEVARAHPGVRYRGFGLGEAGPDRTQEMLGELLALFEAGALRPLLLRTWDITRLPEALRHIGAGPATSARSPCGCRGRGTRTARCWSPGPPEPWPVRSPGTSSPNAGCGTCCCSRAPRPPPPN